MPSTNATTDISTTSAIGTSVEYSRDDHEHSLSIDNTLNFSATDELSVNVQDVIEHLQERIQYFTFDISTSDAGATIGGVFNTSACRKLITKVDFNFAASAQAESLIVRLDELNTDNSIKAKLFGSAVRPQSELGTNRASHHFVFHNAAGEVGVVVDRNIRTWRAS